MIRICHCHHGDKLDDDYWINLHVHTPGGEVTAEYISIWPRGIRGPLILPFRPGKTRRDRRVHTCNPPHSSRLNPSLASGLRPRFNQ